ncbi:Chaperone protein dnaK2 [Planctomycetes bacterium Pan216]|uniref:Chaperone protein dnaK2 n=1 Tax=Kolteria novifilia TaxID=2527975 RepID=A0A518B5L3_9BACT|nr:Chaperone protein dnaK2 [Planctomycetes bacterium Pan216]
MSTSRYIIGIDLGTTNSVVSYLDTDTGDEQLAEIPILDVHQLLGERQVGPRPRLPSFLYLPSEHEVPEGSLALPWDEEARSAVGEMARQRAAMTPGRVVTSAKSWLCHAAVDRTANILPWGAPEEVARVSPVEASTRYLAHLRHAWNYLMGKAAPFEEQEVILTVPASFDEVARELTVEAARDAGIEHLLLIEEPQSVFYNWLFDHRDDWAESVEPGQLILVADVGGGTSDFSLIEVEAKGEEVGFRRIAVGEHLLLGGDNMDLALAASLEEQLVAGEKRLDAIQWATLQHACRAAKEDLLSPEGPKEVPVTVAGRGSSLIGGTLRASLSRTTTIDRILNGFFPLTGREEMPSRSARAGLQEFGLPYTSDPAISRHIAAFLRDASPTSDQGPRRPNFVLFNGGVFKPDVLRERFVDLVGSWFPDEPPPVILNRQETDLDRAVARGAAYYGLVRRGRGVRIAGGTPRSFYVGLGGAGSAAEGDVADTICIAPQGLEEGDQVEIPDREFELLIRQPVSFPFYSSRTRPTDAVGTMVASNSPALTALPPIRAVLPSGKKSQAATVRVHLDAILTEVGTLEIWCVTTDGDRRWRLQFDVRQQMRNEAAQDAEDDLSAVVAEDVLDQALIDKGQELIRASFGSGKGPDGLDAKPERLAKNLEVVLERGKNSWPPNALRGLWPAVLELEERRQASPAIEVRWLNLAGFLLRPGFGYPLDEWQVKQLWRLFQEGVRHRKDVQSRSEWWVLWRRVAGGLTPAQQQELFRRVVQNLPATTAKPKSKRRGGRSEQEETEMWRLAASLERINASDKLALGERILKGLRKGNGRPFEFWCLGRLGARVPFHGPADTVIAPTDVEPWINQLIDQGETSSEALFALVEMARRCGDRARDLKEDLRDRVMGHLQKANAAERLVRIVEEVVTLEAKEESMIFGESLPAGLRLVD